jgi:hypothetical protein
LTRDTLGAKGNASLRRDVALASVGSCWQQACLPTAADCLRQERMLAGRSERPGVACAGYFMAKGHIRPAKILTTPSGDEAVREVIAFFRETSLIGI